MEEEEEEEGIWGRRGEDICMWRPMWMKFGRLGYREPSLWSWIKGHGMRVLCLERTPEISTTWNWLILMWVPLLSSSSLDFSFCLFAFLSSQTLCLSFDSFYFLTKFKKRIRIHYLLNWVKWFCWFLSFTIIMLLQEFLNGWLLMTQKV